jgi:uncharacterized protein (DUF1697 family)
MERLRELFSELGLSNVRTYINSGNVFFDSDMTNLQALRLRIEQHLKENLGYEVPVFLRSIDEFECILNLNPFKDIKSTSDMRFCIIFTSETIPPFKKSIYSSKRDMEIIGTTQYEAFVVWRIINGRPPSGTFTESELPSRSTTRFFHTALKILAAAKKGP